ncbi:MAG: 4-hydroxy-tetrahydrodipicolinate reductase [Acetobacteraceae bacterium]|nr:4-hydroxy-tetrahydrodipicolinate reductase [Acetobacteraceae bacterium]
MTTRIGIAGCAGRMGRLLAAEVRRHPGAKLVAGSVRKASEHEGADIGRLLGTAPVGVIATHDARALFGHSDVVIDFTVASAAVGHAQLAAELGKALVLGSSGLTAPQEDAIARAARKAPIIYAANFAPGANLLFALVERMAKVFEADAYDIEILETHHRQKIDSPSGTAIALGRAAAKGRGVELESVRQSGRDGHHGPREPGAIGFAALRGGQVVGEHEVRFLGTSEHITLGHRAFDRAVYAQGAVRAALWVAGKPPGLYGMADVLGL